MEHSNNTGTLPSNTDTLPMSRTGTLPSSTGTLSGNTDTLRMGRTGTLPSINHN